ncbi:MAG: hypothetical protein KUG56_03460 [Kordiimonadaceae bacterium]|nr:hypothetical protein [Kordiimonadaceae bacterium]
MNGSSKKNPPPYSLRLTWDERAALDRMAGKLPISTYIRSVLFAFQPPKLSATNRRQTRFGPPTRRAVPTADKQLLAHILAKQGQNKTGYSLTTLADAARAGALYVSPEVQAAILTACDETSQIKTMLMQALNVQEG